MAIPELAQHILTLIGQRALVFPDVLDMNEWLRPDDWVMLKEVDALNPMASGMRCCLWGWTLLELVQRGAVQANHVRVSPGGSISKTTDELNYSVGDELDQEALTYLFGEDFWSVAEIAVFDVNFWPDELKAYHEAQQGGEYALQLNRAKAAVTAFEMFKTLDKPEDSFDESLTRTIADFYGGNWGRACHEISTGAVCVADIALIVKSQRMLDIAPPLVR